MKSPRGRNPNLADAMILVAATAVGLSLVPPDWVGGLRDTIADRDPLGRIDHSQIRRVVALGINPIWLAWTYALLAIRLRSPRPPVCKLARQPGMIASYSASIMGAFGVIVNVIRYLSLFPNHGFREGLAQLDGFAGPAVIVAWLTLLLGDRWRPEPGPIDVLGRIVGAGWIAMYLVGWGILLIRQF